MFRNSYYSQSNTATLTNSESRTIKKTSSKDFNSRKRSSPV